MEIKPTTSLPQTDLNLEEARIRAAFARRRDGARYSWFDADHLFRIQGRERLLMTRLKRYGFASLDTKSVLEIGCGTGYWLREFIKWGARPEHIVAVDLLSNRVAEAKRLCPATLTLECGSAAGLSFPDETFDLNQSA